MLNNWNIRFWEYEFLAPQWLWLLVVVPFILFFYHFREKRSNADWKFSGSTASQHKLYSRKITLIRQSQFVLYSFGLILLILALSKPFNWQDYEDTHKEYKDGIDIILTIDISTSMLAQDFKPNRLEAAKSVAKDFIKGRKGDRIGLVLFAGQAFTASPATLDYPILNEQIDKVTCDVNIESGTAIGVGLGTAVTRLRNDSIPSKVIILLTDGSNNAGTISPEEAAELALAKNIRVYTIGVGSMGVAPTPVMTPFGIHYQNMPVEIDEMTLTKIAQRTNGRYFRATDEKSLANIYKEIDKMEKRKMLYQQFKSEPPAMPMAFMNWAIVCFIVAWGSQRILFKRHE